MNIKQKFYKYSSHEQALNKVFISETLMEIEQLLIELKNIHKPFFESQFNKRDLKNKIKQLKKEMI